MTANEGSHWLLYSNIPTPHLLSLWRWTHWILKQEPFSHTDKVTLQTPSSHLQMVIQPRLHTSFHSILPGGFPSKFVKGVYQSCHRGSQQIAPINHENIEDVNQILILLPILEENNLRCWYGSLGYGGWNSLIYWYCSLLKIRTLTHSAFSTLYWEWEILMVLIMTHSSGTVGLIWWVVGTEGPLLISTGETIVC